MAATARIVSFSQNDVLKREAEGSFPSCSVKEESFCPASAPIVLIHIGQDRITSPRLSRKGSWGHKYLAFSYEGMSAGKKEDGSVSTRRRMVVPTLAGPVLMELTAHRVTV